MGSLPHSAAVRVADFNLRLASYAHVSWAGDLAARASADEWRNSRVVSRWLAHEAGVLDLHDWRMKEGAKRIFLMDAEAVQRVAYELGAAMQREHLIVQVRRDRVLMMREAFGDELLSFVFEQAPASLPATPPLPQQAADAGQLREQTQRLGARALLGLLEPDWVAVRKRAELMFDRRWKLGSQLERSAGRAQKALLSFVVDTLITKRVPQWQWLY